MLFLVRFRKRQLKNENIVLHIHKNKKYEVYKMPTPHHASSAVRRALRKLGGDIQEARRRRRLPMSVVADRAFTSRPTLQRIEAGDPSVGMGIYGAVLQALGLLDGLGRVADVGGDSVGQALVSSELPKHIHIRRKTGASKDG